MRPAVVLLLASLFSCGPLASSSFLLENKNRFPLNPDKNMTPGTLCENGEKRHYPKEDFIYCNRNVKSDLKKEIIANYDKEFGYEIGEMNRADFKIDHYIPLCMGGSNDEDNLWPQHKTVYAKTDPLEPLLCDEMRFGERLQENAVATIKDVKLNLEKAEKLLKELEENKRKRKKK